MYKIRLALFKAQKLLGPMGKLWNNGRMDSQPFLIWIALFILTQWHRHTIIPLSNVAQESALVWGWPIILSLGIIIFAGKNPRILAASVGTMCVAMWMLWATILGPTLPIFMTGFMLTLALGFPFWHARANYRIGITRASTPNMITKGIDEVPKGEFDSWLKGAAWDSPNLPTITGGLRRLRLPGGSDVRAFINGRVGAMANHLQISPDDIELLEAGGHLVDVYTHRVDILAEPTEWPNLRATTMSIMEPIPIGLNRDGSIKDIDLVEKHLLVGGESGSGKSNIITMIVGTGVMDPNCIVLGMDGKRTELYPFRNLMAAYVQDEMGPALALLKAIQDQMGRDQDLMNELGIRKFTDSGGLIKPKLLVIDELARYLRVEDKTQKADFIKRLSDILDRGRSVGVMVVAVTQVPSKNLMTGDMKRGFTHRMALRMSDTDGSEFVLETRIPDASKLSADFKGYGYVRESGNARKFRAFWVPDLHIKDMASRAYEPAESWEIEGNTKPMITAGALAFPDGENIPMNRINLWEALTDEPQTVKEIADSASVTPPTARKALEEWSKLGYVKTAKIKNATTYSL